MYRKEPFNDTFAQLGSPHEKWGTAANRFYAGFEVLVYLLSDPRVMEILECLCRAPGALITDTPFPEPKALPVVIQERPDANKWAVNTGEPLPFLAAKVASAHFFV